jgi:hypothetical protein
MIKSGRSRNLILSFAVSNAILYSCLLPLWEGFDEPFHFDYVQHLANGDGFPDPLMTRLSQEVHESLLLAPGSLSVQRNLPSVMTYETYFSLPQQERERRREALLRIPTESRWKKSEYLNYEAHHAPLAYAMLAIPERILTPVPIAARVLALRIAASLAGSLLLIGGMLRLYSDLRLPDSFRISASFCVLACQMTWATFAHVANDWLAVPLALWLLSMLIRYWNGPSVGAAARLGVVLSAGLLTKAYFLALLPVALAILILAKKWKPLGLAVALVLLLAGPWYARNTIHGGTITGMQEARSGISLTAVLQAAPLLDWLDVLVTNARWALWTGNNTFLTFSIHTLNTMLLLLLAALLVWATRRRHSASEWIAVSYCVTFLAALSYSTVVHYLFSKGVARGPSPWYVLVLIPPVMGFAYLGCARAGALGRYLAGGLATLSGYVIIATYIAKLIPLYGGYRGRSSLADLSDLYWNNSQLLIANLNSVGLVPAYVLLVLTVVVSAQAVILKVVIVRPLFARDIKLPVSSILRSKQRNTQPAGESA